MSDQVDQQHEDPNQTLGAKPRQLSTSYDDFIEFDFNSLKGAERAATYHQLHSLFSKEVAGDEDTARSRAAFTVAAITSLFIRSEDPNRPFGPMFVFNTGRSADMSDFRSSPDVIKFLADTATHPLLKARCADIYWLYNRSQGTYAQMAIRSYLEAVEQIGNSRLEFDFSSEMNWLHPDVIKYLTRALQISRGIRKQSPDLSGLHAMCATLFHEAISRKEAHAVLSYGKLCLQYEIIAPEKIAEELEAYVIAANDDGNFFHFRVELWRLAASCYHNQRNGAERYRCQAEAAEELARHALRGGSPAMVSASFLMDAVRQLQGIPGKRERRNELKDKLLQVQSLIYDELSTYSHEIDLREVIEETHNNFADRALLEQLIKFSILDISPDPDQQIEAAKQMIKEYPLSSLFPAVILDRDGKVIEKADGGGSPGEPSESAIAHQIERNDSIRRHLVVHGRIEAARRVISSSHVVEGEKLFHLFAQSPFVPPHLVRTFSQGVARFFQGDFISALYTLTPLLEAGVKHVLKQRGVDVSNFDDSNETQEDKNVGSLFISMRHEIDLAFTPAIASNIDRVFLSKFGPHIRHAVAHGLLSDGDPFDFNAIYACFLLVHLSMYPLVPHREQLQSLIGAYLEF